MTTGRPLEWQCPTCGERHDGSFDICWKCGSDRDGDRDPAFVISEPVQDVDQAPVNTAQPRLPELRLPVVTYFSLPAYVWMSLAVMRVERPPLAGGEQLEPPISPSSIAIAIAFALVVQIPICVTFLRAAWLLTRHRLHCGGPPAMVDLLWMLSMFRLPESIDRRHRWFGWVYYGAMVAAVASPLGLTVLRWLRFT